MRTDCLKWHVVYTKPKHELKVAKRMEKMGIEVYCPTKTEVRQWSDRKKKITVPLFPSYVFVRVGEEMRNEALQVPGVVGFVYWLGKHAIVRDAEMEIIQDWNKGVRKGTTWVEAFTPGDRVSIANGAFDGEKALIKEVGTNQLKLLLPEIGIVLCVGHQTELKKAEV